MTRLLAAALGLVGVVLLLCFAVYAFFAETLGTPGAVLGGASLLSLALWIWLDWAALSRAAASQGARYNALSVLMVVVALAIAIAANVLAHRYDDRVDLSEAGTYTLSPETEKIVQGLDRPVEIIAFLGEASPDKSRFEDLIAGYRDLTDKLTVRVLDPLRSPLEAEQYKVTSQLATVVLVSGEDQQRVENDITEEALTNALARLTSGVQHRICTVTGHRELDGEDDYSPSGLGAALTKLRGKNYKVEKVNLSLDPIAGCEVLLAADPQTDFLPIERERVAQYVAMGGDFFLLLDPTHAPVLAKDLIRYGVLLGEDIVVDQGLDVQVAGMDPSYIVLDAQAFDFHPITEALEGMVLFRVARSVRKGEDVAGLNVQELLKTSVQGWAETSIYDMQKALAPDPGEDVLGPVSLMVAVEVTDPNVIAVGPTSMGADTTATDYPSILKAVEQGGSIAADGPNDGSGSGASAPAFERKAGGHVIVVGDSDFASNELVDQLTNQDLLLNAIAFLVGETDQLSTRAKGGAADTLTLTLGQSMVLWLLSVLVAPGVAMLGALLTWRARRSL